MKYIWQLHGPGQPKVFIISHIITTLIFPALIQPLYLFTFNLFLFPRESIHGNAASLFFLNALKI